MTSSISTKRKYLIFIYSFVFLLIALFIIFKKEQLKRNGQPIFMKLAPLDPRSIMQGDYMQLRYEILPANQDALSKIKSPTGMALIYVNAKSKIAEIIEFPQADSSGRKSLFFEAAKEITPAPQRLAKLQKLNLQYKLRAESLKIGVATFMFQEDSAKKYEQACYAALLVEPGGKTLLADLHDCQLNKITANTRSIL